MSDQTLIYKVTGGDGYKYYVREANLKGTLDTELEELGPGDRITIELSDMTEEVYDNISDEVEDY